MDANGCLKKGHEPVAYRRRFRILFALVAAGFLVLFARTVYLQIVKGEEYAQRSENNSIRLRRMNPDRGLIMDAKGRVLVDNRPSFDVMFSPKNRRDRELTIEKLEAFYSKRDLRATEEIEPEKVRPFQSILLDKNVDMDRIALVETNALHLPGVFVEVIPVRLYHEGETMAPVIGYTGEISREELEQGAGDRIAGDLVGKNGVEKEFDDLLRGRAGAEQIEVNAIGNRVRVLGRVQPLSGHHLTLTIDAKMQKAAWDALGGRPGAAVVMDPRDGSILALVSSPSFDPNWFSRGISLTRWQDLSRNPKHPMENRAIAGQYPPGSTYKIVVAAAALEEGLITPETTFFCNGSFALGNRTYRCWLKGGHGNVNLHRALVESCDVYFYNLGRLLGVDRLAKYARAFGFGTLSGIDLPRERPGLIPTKEWKLQRFREPWLLGETISLAIGQGFNAATPLQLANAYAAIANGGTLFRPRIVRRVQTADGRPIRDYAPEKKGVLPLRPQHIETIRKALWGVVNEPGGTGYALRRKAADVCGKTGTAQVVEMPEDDRRRKHPLPSHFQDHALFVCFAPCNAPEIVIAVIVEHAGHGGAAAAPVARKILDAYFASRDTPPAGPAVAAWTGAGEARTPDGAP